MSVLLLLACGTTRTGGPPADSADTAADTGDTGDTGPDPDTLDQDGDGYRPLDGDCDDALPHVHPGAPDYCDGLDQDCDGEPIPDGSCGEVGDATAMWTWAIEGGPERAVGALPALGDVDGDGRADVGVRAYHADSAAGPLRGAEMDGLPGRSGPPALAWSADFPTWPGTDAIRAGDVDADGYADVWADCDSSNGYTGGLFLFFGRPGGFGDGEVRQDLLADAWWSDRPALEYSRPATGADVTGDGHDDAVLMLSDATSVYLALLAGSPTLSGHAGFDDLPRVLLDTDVHGGDAYLQADLDGDGFDEWVASAGGVYGEWDTLTIVEGEDLVDGAAVSEVGNVSWYEAEGSTWLVSSQPVSAPDIDGDGLADLALELLAPDASLLLTSGGIPRGDLAEWVHVSVSDGVDGNLPPNVWSDDVDGDGLPDLLASSTLLPSTTLAVGGALTLDAIPHRTLGWEGGVVSRALTDMTGDGYPEWVLDEHYWYPEGSAYDYNRVLIIEGFPIPWDDPSKW